MKKIANLYIVLGLLCLVGIIFISAISEGIPGNVKTIGFIVLGYIGAILFSYGWIKRTKSK